MTRSSADVSFAPRGILSSVSPLKYKRVPSDELSETMFVMPGSEGIGGCDGGWFVELEVSATSVKFWRPLSCRSEDGAVHCRATEVALVTLQASPHTRTEVAVVEKPLPAIVSVAPPASVVEGPPPPAREALVALTLSPSTVGRDGSPRALPQVVLSVIVCDPESGGAEVHVKVLAVTPVGTHGVTPPT